MQIIVATHKTLPTNPSQAKCINALPSNDTNNLSPLVVSKPKIPFLGDPPGTFFSHISITVIHNAIKIKKVAVCHVQAIQENKSKSKKPFSFALPTSPQVAAYSLVNIKPFPLQIL